MHMTRNPNAKGCDTTSVASAPPRKLALTCEAQPEHMDQGLHRDEDVLKPQGDQEPITKDNLEEYLALRASCHTGFEASNSSSVEAKTY